VGFQTGLVLAVSTVAAYSTHIFATGHMNSMIFPTIFVLLGIGVLYLSSMQLCTKRYTVAALHPMEKLAFIYSWDVPCYALTLIAMALASGWPLFC